MKINISIDDRLVEKLDQFVEANYTNRSAVITTALCNLLRGQELHEAVIRVSYACDRAAREGKISPDDLEEFQSIQALATIFGSSKK